MNYFKGWEPKTEKNIKVKKTSISFSYKLRSHSVSKNRNCEKRREERKHKDDKNDDDNNINNKTTVMKIMTQMIIKALQKTEIWKILVNGKQTWKRGL